MKVICSKFTCVPAFKQLKYGVVVIASAAIQKVFVLPIDGVQRTTTLVAVVLDCLLPVTTRDQSQKPDTNYALTHDAVPVCATKYSSLELEQCPTKELRTKEDL